MSPTFLSSEDVERTPVKSIIEGHLANLIGGFYSYFPHMEEKYAQLDWVRNPFVFFRSVIRKNSLMCHLTVAYR